MQLGTDLGGETNLNRRLVWLRLFLWWGARNEPDNSHGLIPESAMDAAQVTFYQPLNPFNLQESLGSEAY